MLGFHDAPLRQLRAIRQCLVWLVLASAGACVQAQDGVRSLALPAASVSAAVVQTVVGILGYTRWPVEASPVQLCLTGETAHAQPLLTTTSLQDGRKLLVRRISIEEAQPLNGCHALYAGRLPPGAWQRLMATWPVGQPLLTLSEVALDCATGGTFCLDISPQGVSFELNLDSMARSGVRVNPRVLGLARRKDGA